MIIKKTPEILENFCELTVATKDLKKFVLLGDCLVILAFLFLNILLLINDIINKSIIKKPCKPTYFFLKLNDKNINKL